MDLSQPRVMAVINVTPDSFSDGGRLYREGRVDLDTVLREVECAIDDGAALIDIGGESTRPGAVAVSEGEEADRVLPVVEAISRRFDTIISVDSSNARVMREAAALGAGLLNDVRSFRRDGALQAAADAGLPVCVMHMSDEPDRMQLSPQYSDIVTEVRNFLCDRIAACRAVGIASDQIVIDPGFGFGKTLEHNLALFRALPNYVAMHYPVLVGVSRKTMIGDITARPVNERLAGSITLAAVAAQSGAHIIRAHDVRETVDALAVVGALAAEESNHGKRSSDSDSIEDRA